MATYLGIFILLVLPILWWMQQKNVDFLDQQLKVFQQQIDALPATVAPKDKLALGKDRLTLEKDRVNAQNAIYGTLVQALGGAFFFVTAYLTWRNVNATEEKQVTERFSKAIEQIGSEQIQVRIGGIYSLERIAKDSPKDHWTIMEVLTSFVQEKSPKRDVINTKITLDIQAALIVIGRRDSSEDPKHGSLDLSNTNLIEAKLFGANFSGADFSRAILYKASFMAVNFSNALLLETHFCGAILSRANLSGATLWKADFRGVKALTPHEVKSAQNWEEAIYDEDFRKELGLPTESRNDKQNS